MRAAVYYNNRDLRVEETPRPAPGPGELLMRVEASGICGSDLMEWYRIRKAPLVLGHEVAGTVEETGPGLEAFRRGDRIVTTHHVPCGTCRYCAAGHHSVCETLRTTRFDPGGFAEFVRVPALNVEKGTFRVPDAVSLDDASFVEPLACVLRAQRRMGLGPGRAAAVLGSGVSGVLHLQAARALGAGPLIATDVHPFRLEAAARLGAHRAVPATADVPGVIRALNSGRLADAVIVTTAAAPALEQAFSCVDRGGTVLFFAPTPPETRVGLPLWDLWHDEIQVMTSYAGPPGDMEAALDLIASGAVDVAAMVTHRIGLDAVGEGFRMMEAASDSLKIIVHPHR
jgi:L-iditol 2-dehydrogenase